MITPYVNEEELKKVQEELNQENQQVTESYSQENAAPTTAEAQIEADAANPDNVKPIDATQQAQQQQGNIGRDIAEGVFAAPIAALDFGLDVVGMLPGGDQIDDAWDEMTKFKNPIIQGAREALSIILPSMVGGIGAAGAVTKLSKLPRVIKGLSALGIMAGTDAAVTAVSDQSEDHNLAYHLDKMFPQLNIPANIKTLDSDSPEVRRQKNIYESAGSECCW